MPEPNHETPETELRMRLQRTIDLVCEDAARIELWACALNGFAQPVPDYNPDKNTFFGESRISAK